MKHFVAHCGTFPYDVLFSLGTEKELFKYLEKYFDKKQIEEVKRVITTKKGYKARFFMVGSQSIIHFPNYENSAENYAIMQHELLHAVINILDYAGIRLTKSSEEVYTYLLQHLTEQFIKGQA